MTPMRRRNTLCIVITLALGGGVSAILPAQTPAPRRNIDSLLARMTLEEKLGQLNLPSVDNRPSAEQLELLRKGLVGGFLNLTGAAATRETQRVAVTESRLGIPLLLGYDVIHGYRTTFPIPLAEASTWDPAAVEAAAHVTAVEAAAAGVNWTFAPMVDIARDPRWGRIAEGSGEDPYLGSVMAAAWVHGFQGADLRASDAVLATAKHFAAYGGAEGARDYTTVDVSERTLRETYLPPFRATVDAAVRRVLQAKLALGLFDDPYHGATVERERATSLAPQHRELARRVAREAIVLLKNDTNLLPLDTTRHTLAVIGPLADDKVAVLGPWAGHGDPQDAVTPLGGVRARAREGTKVLYPTGSGIADSATAC